MVQDWKTLAIVVIGAALAGWFMVRALGGGRRVEAPPAPVAEATVPAPAATAALAANEPTAARTPAQAAAAPPSLADAPPANDGDESAAIERDLGALAGLLVRDQRIEDRVMPRINDVVEVPGVTSYRRAPDFWDAALGGGQGTAR